MEEIENYCDIIEAANTPSTRYSLPKKPLTFGVEYVFVNPTFKVEKSRAECR